MKVLRHHAPDRRTIVHMHKQTSHSSHILKINNSDGSLSFRRLAFGPAPKQLRHQLGPEVGDDLLAWASTSRSEGSERINRILELIVDLEELSLKKGDKEEHTFGWHGKVFTAKVNMGRGSYPKKSDREVQLASELNHRLLRYQLSPYYWMTLGDYPIIGWWSRKNRPRSEDDPTEEESFTEDDAIIAIVDLAREGLLNRIRRCHCKDWFFASNAHQKFCCTRCQQKYFRSSEDYKAGRRAYMKTLRSLHKKTYLVSPNDRKRKAKRVSPS